jgi:hypothetical protein
MRGLYRNFLLIAAFTASLSHAGWKGGYGMGQVNVANGGKIVFANGSTITGDVGGDFEFTPGTGEDLDLYSQSGAIFLSATSGGTNRIYNGSGAGIVTADATGLLVATGKHIDFANGSTISGDTAADTIVTMGTGLHFDVIEAAGDGGIARPEIEDGGVTRFRGAAGSAELAITDAGLFASDIADSAGTGPVTFREGISVATAKTLAFANGATISGDTASATILQGGDGQDVNIVAGNTIGDNILFTEGTGDGGHTIMTMTNADVTLHRQAGAADMNYDRSAADGLTFATGTKVAFANGATISGDSAADFIITGGTDAGTDTVLIPGNATGDLFLKDEDGDKVFEALSGQSGTFINGPTGGREIFVTSTGIAGATGATPISIDSGSGIQFANGFTLSGDTASASIIQGGNGQDLDIIAGNTAGDDVRILEGTGDGSQIRLLVAGGANMQFNDAVGTNQLYLNTGGLYGNGSLDPVTLAGGATIPGALLGVDYIELDGQSAAPADPAAGDIRIWAPLDSVFSPGTNDNHLYATDQASTDTIISANQWNIE